MDVETLIKCPMEDTEAMVMVAENNWTKLN